MTLRDSSCVVTVLFAKWFASRDHPRATQLASGRTFRVPRAIDRLPAPGDFGREHDPRPGRRDLRRLGRRDLNPRHRCGELKGAGLSRTKAEAMIDLAEHVSDGRVHLARHGYMSDDEILAEVTAVRGIGPWTAHMYLMHTMGRRDVWPVGDYGVRNGWSIIHQLDETISERDLAVVGERFAGRS